ncbi:MAG: hypothetical protein JWM82_2627 [Myxococcales bacterium]|nr:hypothetical protein [Myxococcales bacterium]
MKWYRRMYFKTFEWYREMNGPESWPASYAASILGVLHWLNIATVSVVLNLSEPSIPSWAGSWFVLGMVAALSPPMWCSFHADDIEAEFSSGEEIVNPQGRLWLGVYAGGTFLSAAIFGVTWIIRAHGRLSG